MNARPGRPRVLVIAESSNPEWTSVPLVGWSHARALTEVADTHVVTHVRNREAFLRAGLAEGRDFTAVDSEAVARPAYALAEKLRGGSGRGWTMISAFSSFSYYYFEHLVWSRFGRAIRSREYDVVHRLTPLSPVTPSLLASACRRAGVPFILGPLNGGVPWPRGFDSARRREREWLSYVRGAYRMLPGYRPTLRDSAAVLVASRDTWAQIPSPFRKRCVYIPENAVDPARFPEPPPRSRGPRLRLIFLGRLVPYKGADLLIHAAESILKEDRAELVIVGDGPERQPLERLIAERGLERNVRLLGWVDQTLVHRHLEEADVLAFPSIREFGGAVVLEAMAAGAVPIVMDYGGPGELVSPSTGYLLPMGPRASIIEKLRVLLRDLGADPGRLERLRAAGLKRIRTSFTWRAKAAQVLEVYRWVLGARPDKPDFGMPLHELADGEPA
jgi:glycosyltransferase involved in cell wall biosynthesis